ncbi:thiamine pyrophosphate-binding protein [Ideonella sp. B508-1]|uniref:thiamine pyrophosphate-binding protein n=1 Tax=Ideonella sp. B508-1 TaxID=137716 RepID=UPI0003497180|nr:thiamine pyrophosphate-binding protein [Ideonella sp. B508-1]
MTQRLADWLMSRLADEGIGHVFVLPGGGAMHLNDALACQPRLQAVACQHEQACGIAAEAYGRTGRPGAPTFGVAMVTTGPGATNIVTPVAGAWIDSVPMLVISGQAKRADRLRGRPLRQTGVQEVDIVPLVRPITKFAAVVDEPADIRALLEEALHHMRSGAPGRSGWTSRWTCRRRRSMRRPCVLGRPRSVRHRPRSTSLRWPVSCARHSARCCWRGMACACPVRPTPCRPWRMRPACHASSPGMPWTCCPTRTR